MKARIFIFIFLTNIISLTAQNNWYTKINMPLDTNIRYYQQNASSALYDNDGTLWVSYLLYGIGRFKNNIYTKCQYAPSRYISELCKDDNYVYAASDKGVYRFNGNSWEVFLDTTNGLNSNYVYGITYNNNKFYIRTNLGLNIYDTQTSLFNYVNFNTPLNYPHDKRAVTFYDNNIYLGDVNCIYIVNNNVIIDTIDIPDNYEKIITDIQFTSTGRMYICNKSAVYIYEQNELFNIKDFYNIQDWEIRGTNYFKNILVDNDTAYLSNGQILKLYNNGYKIYNHYFNDYISLQGILFKNENENICLIDKQSYYLKFNFSNYHNVLDLNQESFKFLNINNVNAGFGQGSLLFWDNYGNPKYEVPKGSGKHSMFASGLWIGGYDNNEKLHTAAIRYRASGADFFPGPLNNIGKTDSAVSYSYNKVWKINRLDVEELQYRYHHGMLNQIGYSIPEDILTWPANGNTSLGYAQNIAPYYDANGDSVYNVYDGDYPIIKGDQQIFSIFNDNLAEHKESKGRALGIEIQSSFYAYYTCADSTDSTSAINNTTFLHYKITNKSDSTYNNVYVGFYSDADIGTATNDMIASNVELKSFYLYNGMETDGDGAGNTYGVNPPAQSITFLKGVKADNADGLDNNNNGQIDEVNETCDFNHFLYYNNSNYANGDPTIPMDYYNCMRSMWKDTTHLKYGGNGFNLWVTDTIAEYMFPGNSDPNNYGTHGIDPGFIWSSIDNDTPNDKRGVGSIGPFTLDAGKTIEFELAFVWSRDTVNRSIDKLFKDIKNVRYWYDNNINLSCLELDTTSIGISSIPENNLLKIYPNPVNDRLFVDYENNNAKCKITDVNGKLIFETNLKPNITEINTSKYAKGVYIITISDNNKTISRKFVK